jgi:hypothetical protein
MSLQWFKWVVLWIYFSNHQKSHGFTSLTLRQDNICIRKMIAQPSPCSHGWGLLGQFSWVRSSLCHSCAIWDKTLSSLICERSPVRRKLVKDGLLFRIRIANMLAEGRVREQRAEWLWSQRPCHSWLWLLGAPTEVWANKLPAHSKWSKSPKTSLMLHFKSPPHSHLRQELFLVLPKIASLLLVSSPNTIFFFFAILGFELRAYTLSHSASPFLW